MEESGERWRWVVGYEGLYLVSDLGRVFSTPRNTTNGGFLKLITDAHGYQKVALSKDGKTEKAFVHRLVLQAFTGFLGDGLQANHIDGDRQNNRVENLEWCTQRENIEHELYVLGSIYRRRKLTNEQAEEIRASNEPQRILSEKYGVSVSTIADVRHGRSYKRRNECQSTA